MYLGPNQSLRHILCFSFIYRYLFRSYPWSKKNLVNDWENIIAYWEEPKQGKALTNKCGSFQKQLGCLGGGNRVLQSVSSTWTASKLLHNEYRLP